MKVALIECHQYGWVLVAVWILAIVVVCGWLVYTETGPMTGIIVGLLITRAEIQDLNKELEKRLGNRP